MYTFVVWVISWAMWVYNTTQGFLLVSCYWCKGCSILLIFTNKFVLVLHLSFSFRYLVSGRVKAAAEPQEWSNLGLDMDNFITWQDS